MVSYNPLWRTMKERGVTTYTLIYKHGFSAYTITNLRRNKSITVNTIEKLCTVLNCTPNDILEFVKDEQS
jgi:DNA-binding Xre family transcriptional regulator